MLRLSTHSSRSGQPLATQMWRRWYINSWRKSRRMPICWRQLERVRRSMMISKNKMKKRSRDFKSCGSLMTTEKSSRSQTLQTSGSLKLSRCKCKAYKSQRMAKKMMRHSLQNLLPSWRGLQSSWVAFNSAKKRFSWSMTRLVDGPSEL